MSPVTFSFLCVPIFIFICLAMIVMLVLRGKRDRLSSFTPEQQKALKLQNNALTILVAIVLTGVFLFAPIGKKFPGLANICQNLLIVLGIGVMSLIAISSITSEVTIIRGRSERDDFPQGKTAVNYGIAILAILTVALLLWFAQK